MTKAKSLNAISGYPRGSHACCCIGKQGGEPFCPCEMRARGIFKRDGRWVEPARGERDLGSALDISDFFTGNEEPRS